MGKVLVGNVKGPAGTGVGLAPSADSSGTTDAVSIQNLINLSGIAQLQPGTFFLNGSVALALAVRGNKIKGAGDGTTVLTIGASFSDTKAISITADKCGVSDLSIVGASSTVTSNPVVDGIVSVGQQGGRFKDLFFQYINGWMIDPQGGSTRAAVDTFITNVTGRNCSAGVRILGATGSNYLGEYFVDNLQLQQMGATSGGRANLDAFLIQDVSDVLVTNVNIGTASGTTAGAIHIKGACATIRITNPDCGSNGAAGVAPVYFIESGSNGTPTDVQFIGGASEGGGAACIRIDAGGDITFLGGRTHQAYGTGLVYNGGEVEFVAWSFGPNNQSGSANYDVDTSGATTGNLRMVACRFGTSIGSGVGLISQTASVNSRAYFKDCFFIGGSTAPSNVFTGTPQQVVGCVGYNPRGQVTATTIGTSPFTPGGYQTPLMVIFTAINGMTDFAVGGVSVGLPTVGVPYPIGVRQSMTITYTGTKPTWAWFGL